MLSQRALSRSTQLLGRRMIARTAPRRNYSAAKVDLKGAQDNAFNRERAAVKQHAADSSGAHY
jgi:cytochrome c oxidase subunit 6a